uniref:Uncharacterized protein n=1 Tax=Branchiostoma floridae TaxID=7739 RepID=C3YWA8_BRAFL|eukprot:XP_002599425.1 hypothetical protein BRAFLDRAFT_131439 [Branchiostoma floridae]
MCKVCSSINGRGEAEVRGWKGPGPCAPTTDHLSYHPQAMATKDLSTDTEEDDLPGSLPPFSPPKKPTGPLSEEEEFELIAKWQAGGLTLGQPKSSAITDVTVKYKSREDLDNLGFDTHDEGTGEEYDVLYDLYATMDDVDQTCDRLEDDYTALAPAMEGDHFFFYDEEDECGPNFHDEMAEEESWNQYEYQTTLYPYTKENGGVWYTTEEDGHGLTFEEDDSDNSGSLERQQRVSSGYLSADLSFEQSSRDDSTQYSDSVYIPKGWEKFPREIAKQKFDLKKDPALPSLKVPPVEEEPPRQYRRARSERGEEEQWEVSLADEILQAEGFRSGSRRHSRRSSRDHHRPRILDLRRRSRHDSGPIPGSVRMPSLRDKLEEYQRELEVHGPRRSEPQSRRSSLATTMTGWDLTSMSYSQSQADMSCTEDAWPGGRRRRSAHHHHRSRRESRAVSAATTPRPSRPSSGRSHKHRHGKNKDSDREWKIVTVVGCVIAIGVLIWGLYGHGSTKTTAIRME